MFRKVGGFVYVMSALVSMERCLADSQQDTDENSGDGEQVENLPAKVSIGSDGKQLAAQLRFLHLVFNTLCVAMRYEPANAKFFLQEVRYHCL